MMIRCKMCGALFDDGKPEKVHGRHKVFCTACRLERKHADARRKQARDTARRRAKREAARGAASGLPGQKPKLTIAQVNALAAACGMHYGRYVALYGL